MAGSEHCRVLHDDPVPVVAVTESDGRAAEVAHSGVDLAVAGCPIRVVMVGTVHVYGHLRVVVHVVGSGTGFGEIHLGAVGQPPSSRFEMFEELPLQAGGGYQALFVDGGVDLGGGEPLQERDCMRTVQ